MANMRLRPLCVIKDRLSISSQRSIESTVIKSNINATVQKNEVDRRPALIKYTGKSLFVATSLGLAMISKKPASRIG